MTSPRRRPLRPADVEVVTSRQLLVAAGTTESAVRQQVIAQRWQVRGKAIVLHNGPLSVAQSRSVALINCGPRALLTSFTAAEVWGLQRWTRPETHVVAPAGTLDPHLPGVVLHRVGDWRRVDAMPARRLQSLAQSLVIAASSFRSAGPATAILAAAVQQRLIRADELRRAVRAAPRTRFRHELLLALGDIEQGADALSEINLGRLCRRFGLPQPRRQAVRVEPNGTRRYLDAEFDAADGRLVAVEVDGHHHLEAEQWRRDQLRQNTIVLGGTIVLRYPAFVVRDEPGLVADQLRRALSSGS